MHCVGIICEYNPFHNGHLLHLEKIKKQFPDYSIILVMSGNFTQRGDASIMNKWDKTELALFYGVDLVIELPFVFAIQSADVFAKASIEILDILQVEYLVFGSECNEIKRLVELAKIQLEHPKYDILVQEYLKSGINYPSALSKALYDLSGKRITGPNDLLGMTYIREILKLNSAIKPMCIPRQNDYHSLQLEGTISSAMSIRHSLKNGIDISPYVPNKTLDCLKKPILIENYFSLLKYKILSETNLEKFQMVDEGIENRIMKYITSSKSLDELILKIKTKRYTYHKLNRMFTHILCNVTKEEVKEFNHIAYIRVLGFRKKGREILKHLKNNCSIPVITNFSDLKHPMLDLEFRATCVYASILNEQEKIKCIESEYKNTPIMK